LSGDLLKFEGLLPYASEPFGIFQPILGWKSRLGSKRFANHASQATATVLSNMKISGDLLKQLVRKPGPIDPELNRASKGNIRLCESQCEVTPGR
jgi:hypothetical protein